MMAGQPAGAAAGAGAVGAGAGGCAATTIKPKDIVVADAGPAVENWRSQSGLKIGTAPDERRSPPAPDE
ncbi:hypothetical protein GFS60_06583 (plasmid) [Rhodococcus sp. WAY2]|nr:hypothetical protein GFS60_06583 [Rhodococcus sp. WAY2]